MIVLEIYDEKKETKAKETIVYLERCCLVGFCICGELIGEMTTGEDN
jgi:hypothetical protein